MNIVLIGFRCAGKSTVGPKLAAKLHRDFVDCDEYIEAKTHLSIREIFDIAGEAYFRGLEGQAIADLSKQDGKVIATGGGAALRYKNIQQLKRNGVVFYLEVGAETAYERFRGDPRSKDRRPALTPLDHLSEMQEQVKHRTPYYLNAADHTIRTDGRSVDEVMSEILLHLKERGLAGGADPGHTDPPPDAGDDDELSTA